jgi:MtN3 and saliva related transmembrane protein
LPAVEISMDTITIIGLVAGTLTTIAFVPQLTKTWKSKSAQDISLGMFLLFCSGVLLWLIYGVLIDALPVILANTVTLILSGAILILKLKYD